MDQANIPAPTGTTEYDVPKKGLDEQFRGHKPSRRGATILKTLISAMILGVAITLVVRYGYSWKKVAVVTSVILFLLISSVHIALEWEKDIVLRLGRFNRVCGPGLYFTIPLFEHVTERVDQRIMATSFNAEEALTADLVPLGVDAVLFWIVWDPKKACTEVENYAKTVAWTAQTTMRDVIGRVNLDEISLSRDRLNHEIQEIMDEKTTPWGVTVLSVEIRDITIPKELQNAMSKKAQAEREREARITLAEVEKDISEMFVEAAEIYDKNEKAMQLRTMNLIYESVKDKGGLVVTPSAFAEGFNNINDIIQNK